MSEKTFNDCKKISIKIDLTPASCPSGSLIFLWLFIVPHFFVHIEALWPDLFIRKERLRLVPIAPSSLHDFVGAKRAISLSGNRAIWPRAGVVCCAVLALNNNKSGMEKVFLWFSLISHKGTLWMNRDLNDLFDRQSVFWLGRARWAR